jgi:sugar phosphate isomerase/epimerase
MTSSMNKLIASTLPFLNIPLNEALNIVDEIGFEGVEIYYEGKHCLPKKEISESIRSFDLKLFLHAPFSDLNIASMNRTVLEESKKQIKYSLEVASEIGVKVVTVHFGRYSPLGLSYPEKALKQNRESVLEISAFAENLGIEAAFENAPKGFGAMFGPLDNIIELAGESGIKITLDFGHANTWEEDIGDFVFRLNSFISHVHMHDNTGDSDMHLGIGQGGLNYGKALLALRGINYKNAICLEMLYHEDLVRSRQKIGSLLGV